jgi:23S rRNA (adenine2503-C2)-methyltransferase
MKKNIYDYSLEELKAYLTTKGEKPFRAKQIFEWLYRFRVDNFNLMTNIAKTTIKLLNDEFELKLLELVTKQIANDGTIKYLFRLNDGKLIETVLMRHNYGNSICVTSEVGCNMGCAFCASGELNKIRNLTIGEMVLQVLMVQRDLDSNFQRVSNIVVMGIGEPFDNYDNVIEFLRILNYPNGFEIGARHITVSTCGIVPKIKEFANFDLQVNLAISLHAPNNIIRNQMMKINKKYPLEQLIEAVKEYVAKTNRRVTFEYILLSKINDEIYHAEELAKLIRGINCYVNLIPYNEISTKPFKQTSKKKADAFFEVLRKNGIHATIRIEHGSDIMAACGQLRAKRLKEESK